MNNTEPPPPYKIAFSHRLAAAEAENLSEDTLDEQLSSNLPKVTRLPIRIPARPSATSTSVPVAVAVAGVHM